MIHLLDGNVLIALVVTDHVHHRAASRWFGAGREFATGPITQGTLLRFLLRAGMPAADAWRVLDDVTSRHVHHFWGHDFGYGAVNHAGLLGHRQVTDAYLVELARRYQGSVATFDRGLAARHGRLVTLIDADE